MDRVCPVCNSLVDMEIKCTRCEGIMTDEGRIADYFDDYSSYLDMNITELIDGAPSNQCVHLFYCPNCDYDRRIGINKIPK
jgi:hypothetical protein